ncbi:MAG: serine hydrolase [Eubacteriales bacterium]|nr:serine hydrolase [Eubacteriales bacterium]
MIKERLALEAIREEMRSIPGHVGMYYQNLVTGEEFDVRGEEPFLAASVIKLPLHLFALAQAEAGLIRMSDRLLVEESDKVPVCGALTLFTGPVEADIATLCRLMISLSDNTATNRLIRHFGMRAIEEGFAHLGLQTTRIRRLLFDTEASNAGVQNTISPREMGALLAGLYRREILSEASCEQALDILLQQQIDHKLNGKICGRAEIAHKTGEDDGLSNDVGIVYAKQPFVLCFAGHDTDVYLWEDLMRRGAYALWQAQEE